MSGDYPQPFPGVPTGYVPNLTAAQPLPVPAMQRQVGGSHYKDMAIQPSDYIVKNNIGWYEGNVIKYVSRWKAKGGVADLEKARHYLDLLIESQP